MEVISMLAPAERCVRAKMQLFLRLWTARSRYEGLRPYGKNSPQRLRFHLAQLEACWSRVVAFQKALGLEVIHFGPREQFELIYLITAFVERELGHPGTAIMIESEKWHGYNARLKKLSHDLNPYDFAEICAQCHALIQELTCPGTDAAEIISMVRPYLSHFQPSCQSLA